MTKVFDGVTEEFTFFNLQGDSGGSQCSGDLVDMVYMLINSFRKDDDNVDIDQACFPLEPVKDDVERTLNGRWRIGEAKAHPIVLSLAGVAYE